MTAWLKMWSYRIQERLTPSRPRWLHRLTCSHCRSMARGLPSDEQRARAAS